MGKKILACFVDGIENDPGFKSFVNRFEGTYEVIAFFDIVKNNVMPDIIFNLLEMACAEKLVDHDLYFLTNVGNFMSLCYRTHHETFKHFIYLNDFNVNNEAPMEDIYLQLLHWPVQRNENLFKPIFVSSLKDRIFENQFYNDKCTQLISVEELPDVCGGDSVQKIFVFNNTHFLFETTDGDEKFIALDNDDQPENFNVYNTVYFVNDENHKTAKQICNMLDGIIQSNDSFLAQEDIILKSFSKLRDIITGSKYFYKKMFISYLSILSRSYSKRAEVYILSFLLNLGPNNQYLNNLLLTVLTGDEFDKNERFFLLYQCIRLSFANSNVTNNDTEVLSRRLYRKIYESFKAEIGSRFSFIPKSDRDHNFMIVITSQFLDAYHAPSMMALDRCYDLIKHHGKKVLLLNTKECLTLKGVVPLFFYWPGCFDISHESVEKIVYKDLEIPFYQPPCAMPDIEEILNLLEVVKNSKPYMVISIGGANLTADLCSNLVPVVNIATGSSALPLCEGQFHATLRRFSRDDIEGLREFGFSEANLIASVGGIELKPQSHSYTKEELALPNDKFLTAVVGNRLDLEVTDEFIRTLLSTSILNTHIVFIGKLNYNVLVEKHQRLAENSTYLGYQQDLLAVLEVCDLYVNPLRNGGGFSAAAALVKGKPVVTVGSGDVAVITGEDFWVTSYSEMSDIVERYVRDREFYKTMLEKAKQRADILTNPNEFSRVIKEVESNDLFV